MDPISCTIENAPKFLDWCRNRGGVARWTSVSLSDPGKSWSSPALDKEGKPYTKPHYAASSEPELIEKDPAKIIVFVDEEVKRFRVAVRVSSQGLFLKCTDASTRRIRREVEKAGNNAYYEFDYSEQQAVIMRPKSSMTLAEWAITNAITGELKGS